MDTSSTAPHCGTPKLVLKQKTILIVEGMDEVNFFNSLLYKMEIENIQVLGIGGKTLIHQTLPTLRELPKFNEVSSIGIVRDARRSLGI